MVEDGITYEQIADLDRRGMRDAAIMAALHAEAMGRFARPGLFWGRKRTEAWWARRQRISRDLNLLLSVPRLAAFDCAALRDHLAPVPAFSPQAEAE